MFEIRTVEKYYLTSKINRQCLKSRPLKTLWTAQIVHYNPVWHFRLTGSVGPLSTQWYINDNISFSLFLDGVIFLWKWLFLSSRANWTGPVSAF